MEIVSIQIFELKQKHPNCFRYYLAKLQLLKCEVMSLLKFSLIDSINFLYEIKDIVENTSSLGLKMVYNSLLAK